MDFDDPGAFSLFGNFEGLGEFFGMDDMEYHDDAILQNQGSGFEGTDMEYHDDAILQNQGSGFEGTDMVALVSAAQDAENSLSQAVSQGTVQMEGDAGIQAMTVESLLSQFEDTAASLRESIQFHAVTVDAPLHTQSLPASRVCSAANSPASTPPPTPPPGVLHKIRSKQGSLAKRKATILLPCAAPAKRGRGGRPTAAAAADDLPISAGRSSRLRKILSRNGPGSVKLDSLETSSQPEKQLSEHFQSIQSVDVSSSSGIRQVQISQATSHPVAVKPVTAVSSTTASSLRMNRVTDPAVAHSILSKTPRALSLLAAPLGSQYASSLPKLQLPQMSVASPVKALSVHNCAPATVSLLGPIVNTVSASPLTSVAPLGRTTSLSKVTPVPTPVHKNIQNASPVPVPAHVQKNKQTADPVSASVPVHKTKQTAAQVPASSPVHKNKQIADPVSTPVPVHKNKQIADPVSASVPVHKNKQTTAQVPIPGLVHKNKQTTAQVSIPGLVHKNKQTAAPVPIPGPIQKNKQIADPVPAPSPVQKVKQTAAPVAAPAQKKKETEKRCDIVLSRSAESIAPECLQSVLDHDYCRDSIRRVIVDEFDLVVSPTRSHSQKPLQKVKSLPAISVASTAPKLQVPPVNGVGSQNGGARRVSETTGMPAGQSVSSVHSTVQPSSAVLTLNMSQPSCSSHGTTSVFPTSTAHQKQGDRSVPSSPVSAQSSGANLDIMSILKNMPNIESLFTLENGTLKLHPSVASSLDLQGGSNNTEQATPPEHNAGQATVQRETTVETTPHDHNAGQASRQAQHVRQTVSASSVSSSSLQIPSTEQKVQQCQSIGHVARTNLVTEEVITTGMQQQVSTAIPVILAPVPTISQTLPSHSSALPKRPTLPNGLVLTQPHSKPISGSASSMRPSSPPGVGERVDTKVPSPNRSMQELKQYSQLSGKPGVRPNACFRSEVQQGNMRYGGDSLPYEPQKRVDRLDGKPEEDCLALKTVDRNPTINDVIGKMGEQSKPSVPSAQTEAPPVLFSMPQFEMDEPVSTDVLDRVVPPVGPHSSGQACHPASGQASHPASGQASHPASGQASHPASGQASPVVPRSPSLPPSPGSPRPCDTSRQRPSSPCAPVPSAAPPRSPGAMSYGSSHDLDPEYSDDEFTKVWEEHEHLAEAQVRASQDRRAVTHKDEASSSSRDAPAAGPSFNRRPSRRGRKARKYRGGGGGGGGGRGKGWKPGTSPVKEDKSGFFNKIPTYYTALSIPTKTGRMQLSAQDAEGGSMNDYLPADRSPGHQAQDPEWYDKMPSYFSCFTNSTKYDSAATGENSGNAVVAVSEPQTRQAGRSGDSDQNKSKSPSSGSLRPRSPARARSYERSRLPERDKLRKRRRSNSSSGSSRSGSRKRSWRVGKRRQRRRSPSLSGSSRSSSQSRSRSRSFSRSRSGSRYSRSFSRSHSRSRSRSRSRGRRHRSRSLESRRSYGSKRSRSDSKDRQTRKQLKRQDKIKKMEERKIVYVGRIPEGYTRRQLYQRFECFGKIEDVSVHFREAGDNYGFVTFFDSKDAFRAIDKGNTLDGEKKFDLCFGGRRHFCANEYADLDGNRVIEEEYAPVSNKATMDFDELLRQARRNQKK